MLPWSLLTGSPRLPLLTHEEEACRGHPRRTSRLGVRTSRGWEGRSAMTQAWGSTAGRTRGSAGQGWEAPGLACRPVHCGLRGRSRLPQGCRVVCGNGRSGSVNAGQRLAEVCRPLSPHPWLAADTGSARRRRTGWGLSLRVPSRWAASPDPHSGLRGRLRCFYQDH